MFNRDPISWYIIPRYLGSCSSPKKTAQITRGHFFAKILGMETKHASPFQLQLLVFKDEKFIEHLDSLNKNPRNLAKRKVVSFFGGVVCA